MDIPDYFEDVRKIVQLVPMPSEVGICAPFSPHCCLIVCVNDPGKLVIANERTVVLQCYH